MPQAVNLRMLFGVAWLLIALAWGVTQKERKCWPVTFRYVSAGGDSRADFLVLLEMSRTGVIQQLPDSSHAIYPGESSAHWRSRLRLIGKDFSRPGTADKWGCAQCGGDRMSERWDVSSWDARIGDRSKQFQGCFESKIVADRYVVNDYWAHPDRRYQVEQCKHPEHGHHKAASPSS
jgi:hypothetical protein